jgi:DNA repair exonuclease SbcCD nuclease subunit
MKFIHSADWQLGARFAQFETKSESLRQARLDTLRATLKIARDRQADAFIIAGDLFQDNQVSDSLVAAVLELFREFGSVPIFVLPGNHDPHTGPDSIWNRKIFANAPSNLTIFREPKVVEHAGVYLIASPLTQKVSTIDPSRRIDDLVKSLPSDAIKIGITHGALAIPGKHQPNDFPIDPAAATRSGVDYLAIGHWHNWQVYDNGRLVMPGTPEPDNFGQAESGFVACVEIKAHNGEPPAVEKVLVRKLYWEVLEFDFLDMDNAKLKLQQQIGSLSEHANQCVLRVVLKGSAPPSLLESSRQWIDSELASLLITQIIDQSSVVLSAAELQQVQQDHPLLAQVLNDLTHLEHLVTGSPSPVTHDSSAVISLAEAQQLATNGKIDFNALKSTHFNLARQVLFQKLREVEK